MKRSETKCNFPSGDRQLDAKFHHIHPGKSEFWSPKWRGLLEDGLPFQLGDFFLASMLIFRGVDEPYRAYTNWTCPQGSPCMLSLCKPHCEHHTARCWQQNLFVYTPESVTGRNELHADFRNVTGIFFLNVSLRVHMVLWFIMMI